MLAGAISDPRAVVPGWLRLGGILALAMAGLAGYFAENRTGVFVTAGAVLVQLALVQIAWRRAQRFFCFAAFVCAVATGTLWLQQARPASLVIYAVACIFASVAGLALMDMLLGHAYLNAARMTMSPFRRMNLALAAGLLGRALVSVGISLLLQSLDPIEMFWSLHGLYIGTRWLVGLALPGAFVYMAHDCIRRRSTQSATGILYVACVLIFIGEIMGLYLMRQTGLPL